MSDRNESDEKITINGCGWIERKKESPYPYDREAYLERKARLEAAMINDVLPDEWEWGKQHPKIINAIKEEKDMSARLDNPTPNKRAMLIADAISKGKAIPSKFPAGTKQPTKRTEVKTPKLKAEDRVKLIDRADLLVVVPMTHQASVRYGHGAKWCTATPSQDMYFKRYTEKGFLVYIIKYATNGKNRGDEITKMAISCTPDINKANFVKLEFWSKNNKEVELEVGENFILTEEIERVLETFNDSWLEARYGYHIGSEIECNDISGKFDTIEIKVKGDSWESTIYLNPRDIGKCKVTKINEKSVRADVMTLTLKTKLPKEMLKMLTQLVESGRLNINIKNTYIKGHGEELKVSTGTLSDIEKLRLKDGLSIVHMDNHNGKGRFTISTTPMDPLIYDGWFVEMDEKGMVDDYYGNESSEYDIEDADELAEVLDETGYIWDRCFPIIISHDIELKVDTDDEDEDNDIIDGKYY
jgi:hypothetical protein